MLMLTAYEFDEPPQAQDDKQTREFLFPALEHDLEDERGQNNYGVEEVERGVRYAAPRVVKFEAESPQSNWDFK
jgi:hypothetical protein